MKKVSSILLLFACSLCFAQAQDVATQEKSGQHAVFAELGGNVFILYSLGYDYTLKLKGNHKLSVNCGLQAGYGFSVSPQVSYLYGKKHHLEIGVGGTGYAFGHGEYHWSIPFRLGYRYQSEETGLYFKFAYTPLYTTLPILLGDVDGDFEGWYKWTMPIWVGIAFGYTF